MTAHFEKGKENMNFSAYYKKAWESSLSECTSKLQTELDAALMVIADLKSENARYREALERIENE